MQITRTLPALPHLARLADALRAARPDPAACTVYVAGDYLGEYISADAAQAAISRLPAADRRRAIIADADGIPLQT